MIINQLSCVISILVSYLLSNGKIDNKRRNILILLCILNIIVNLYFFFDEQNFIIDLIFTVLITIFAFVVIFIYDLTRTIDRKRLNTKVNEFTRKANQNFELRMMAGDLTFLDDINNTADSEQRSQLQGFRKIEIIAKRPQRNLEKVRIGKIIDENDGKIEIKFYASPLEDIGLRFRCIKLGNGTFSTLNIYKMSTNHKYILEELNSSLSDQQLVKRNEILIKLFNTYWENLAYDISLINECKNEYKHSIN